MIAWGRILLFERRFMLFVYDEQAKVSERKKEAASYANHDIIGFIAKHLLVKLYPFSVRIAGVIDAQAWSENTPKPFCELSRQDDFGQHEQDLLSFGKGL